MIFYIKEKKLFLCPLDVLFVSALSYSIYGMFWLKNASLFFKEPLIILFSVTVFWLYKKFISNSSKDCYVSLETDLSSKKQYIIYSLASLGIISFLIIYVYYGLEYFSLTKDLRYKYIKFTEIPRILSLVTMIGLFVASVANHQYYPLARKILVLLFWIISFIEINREMMIIMALTSSAHFFKNKKDKVESVKLLSLSTVIIGGFVLIMTKPVLFILQYGIYPENFFYISELSNWVRHFAFVKLRNIDISIVQQYDLQYFLNALIFPFSYFDSASKIFFEKILNNTYTGMTFGYSGLIWTDYYFNGYFLIFPWIFLSMIYGKTFFSKNDFLRITFSLILIIICYRFFRSEWPLVIKTMLWVYFYPTLILYFLLKRERDS